jgi:hypothetical protein
VSGVEGHHRARRGGELARRVPGARRDVEHHIIRAQRQPLEHPPRVRGEHAVARRVFERLGLSGERLLDGLGVGVGGQ